jgi:hypothetical protein
MCPKTGCESGVFFANSPAPPPSALVLESFHSGVYMLQYLFIPAGVVRWGGGRREKISTGLGRILLTLPAAAEYIPTGEGQIQLKVLDKNQK